MNWPTTCSGSLGGAIQDLFRGVKFWFSQVLIGFPIDGCNPCTCVQLKQCLLLTELNSVNQAVSCPADATLSRNAMFTGVRSASTEAATVFEQHTAP